MDELLKQMFNSLVELENSLWIPVCSFEHIVLSSGRSNWFLKFSISQEETSKIVQMLLDNFEKIEWKTKRFKLSNDKERWTLTCKVSKSDGVPVFIFSHIGKENSPSIPEQVLERFKQKLEASI